MYGGAYTWVKFWFNVFVNLPPCKIFEGISIICNGLINGGLYSMEEGGEGYSWICVNVCNLMDLQTGGLYSRGVYNRIYVNVSNLIGLINGRGI